MLYEQGDEELEWQAQPQVQEPEHTSSLVRKRLKKESSLISSHEDKDQVQESSLQTSKSKHVGNNASLCPHYKYQFMVPT